MPHEYKAVNTGSKISPGPLEKLKDNNGAQGHISSYSEASGSDTLIDSPSDQEERESETEMREPQQSVNSTYNPHQLRLHLGSVIKSQRLVRNTY